MITFITILLIASTLLSLMFTMIGISLKEYCPIPLNTFNIILGIVLLSMLHTYFLIVFIIYLIIGYCISIKWYKDYWKNGNVLKLPNINSIEGFVMVCDMIIYWPVYFIKKIKMFVETPFSEASKHDL